MNHEMFDLPHKSYHGETRKAALDSSIEENK